MSISDRRTETPSYVFVSAGRWHPLCHDAGGSKSFLDREAVSEGRTVLLGPGNVFPPCSGATQVS